ncbi:MAG: hypothetical protein N3D12_06595 [Candidatus Methanomethyliaceae archaeon]|nr:hypothetical protein [Candidatus Methanomethyliaceae archaeon]
MSKFCQWLHEQLEQLPLISFPFKLEDLPYNGVYFIYERGEIWGHGGNKPRIVMIGTHTGNDRFRSRINEHYLIEDSVMNFGRDTLKPSDRSIFRLNIGKILLSKNKDSYLQIWDIDFTKSENRQNFGDMRDIKKEKELESTITKIIRENFSFRYIVMDQYEGDERLELKKHLIGTVAGCYLCKPSANWLGKSSPNPKISNGKMWNSNNLRAGPLDEYEKDLLLSSIEHTKEWLRRQ